MARPREFDIDKATEDGMRVFWERGYQGTRLPDLLASMGIARGSFYKAFGGKKALFLKALDNYEVTHVRPAVEMLRDSQTPGIDRIKSVFNAGLQQVRDGDTSGCLLCNSAAEADLGDDEIRARVRTQLELLCEGFASALADHLQIGSETASEKAQELTMDYVGLRILARGAVGRDMLENAVASRLRAIGSRPV